jgi:hypothetical protein
VLAAAAKFVRAQKTLLNATLTSYGEIMILVTGATGFLGKHVCRKLELSGHAFTRTSLSLGTDLRDFDQTLALFQAVGAKTVLNCASFAGGIQFGLKYPADIFRNNMPMIANLFEAAHRTGVERIVNPIANCVYPAQLTLFEESRFWDGPLHESVMVYGLLRKISWVGSWAYARQRGLETINLVLSNMYGPEDHFEEERSHALGALVLKFIQAKKAALRQSSCGEPERRSANGCSSKTEPRRWCAASIALRASNRSTWGWRGACRSLTSLNAFGRLSAMRGALYMTSPSPTALLTKQSTAAAARLCSAGHRKWNWERVCDGP